MAFVMLAPAASAAAPASGPGQAAQAATASPAAPAAAAAPAGASPTAAGSFQDSLQAELGKPAANEPGKGASGHAPAGKGKPSASPREGEKARGKAVPVKVVMATATVLPALVIATGPVPARPTGNGRVLAAQDGLPAAVALVAASAPDETNTASGPGAFAPAASKPAVTAEGLDVAAAAVTDLPAEKPLEKPAVEPSTPVTDNGAGSPAPVQPVAVRPQAYPAATAPVALPKDHVQEGQSSPAASAAQSAPPSPAVAEAFPSAGGRHRENAQDETFHAGAGAQRPLLPASHARAAAPVSFDATLASHQVADGHTQASPEPAPETATTTQPAANARLVDDIYRQIASRSVVEVNGEHQVIQVTVNPHHLGEVSVRLTVSGSDVSAHLQVPGAAWQHDVVAHHCELAELFTRQGLTLGQLSVGLGSRQNPQAQWSEVPAVARPVVSTPASESHEAAGAVLLPPVASQSRLDCVC